MNEVQNQNLSIPQPSLLTNSEQSFRLKAAVEKLETTPVVGLKRIIPLSDALDIISLRTPKLCSNEKAVEFAGYLGRSMPTGQGTDFDIWISDATLIFCEYPEQDVRLAVESPIKGFRATHKWLPAPCDLVSYFEGLKLRRREVFAKAQLIVKMYQMEVDERKMEHQKVILTPERRAALVAKLRPMFQKEKEL